MGVNKYRHISWEEVDDMVADLAIQIAESENTPKYIQYPKYITGIARGGYIPSVMLSHKLNIDYTDDWLLQPLIVDEICDSGKTLKKYEDYTTAVLIYKPHTSCYEPTFYSEKYEGDDWIVFPWEVK